MMLPVKIGSERLGNTPNVVPPGRRQASLLAYTFALHQLWGKLHARET